jgi:ABC-type molybdate transport system substrate-binding protein
MRALALAVAALAMTLRPAAAETVVLYAAGSLNAALSEMGKAFERATGHAVRAKFGPSGLLKNEIAAGAAAHVFASANMEHPQALAKDNKSGPVHMFARNTLCALVRPGLRVDTASLIERMLDPQIKLGTSTPKADPSGDYAFAAFARADAARPGARAALEAKALQLTGGPASASPPGGRNAYGWHVAEGRADIFLTYCTNAILARRQNPDQQLVALPAPISVGADYGLTVIAGAPPAATVLVEFILSAAGQKILAGFGFAPPSASQ